MQQFTTNPLYLINTFVFDFGKMGPGHGHPAYTFKEAYEKDKGYINWCYKETNKLHFLPQHPDPVNFPEFPDHDIIQKVLSGEIVPEKYLDLNKQPLAKDNPLHSEYEAPAPEPLPVNDPMPEFHERMKSPHESAFSTALDKGEFDWINF